MWRTERYAKRAVATPIAVCSSDDGCWLCHEQGVGDVEAALHPLRVGRSRLLLDAQSRRRRQAGHAAGHCDGARPGLVGSVHHGRPGADPGALMPEWRSGCPGVTEPGHRLPGSPRQTAVFGARATLALPLHLLAAL